ncbi:MAG: SUMO ubiquitin activating enzyme E1 subunit UBA2 [Amphiamblys sp. WSBS2006]|nr:MAG: SUMO ubiquitin activating enzyme E1 subunit UBA2 [Amphiamblys sp. WSBS2006]
MEKRLLVIGAGGIGCEVIKTLVLSGFRQLEVVDGDIIEFSNLHRQFLFSREDIGKNKAEVACRRIRELTGVVLKAHVGDVSDRGKFPLMFFKAFDALISAVDNIKAREHINRVGILFGLPVIESGSAGYLGQCYVVLSPETECYSCIPREQKEIIPVCSIRTKPDSVDHCAIWARDYFFEECFGKKKKEGQGGCNVCRALDELGGGCGRGGVLCCDLEEFRFSVCGCSRVSPGEKRRGRCLNEMHGVLRKAAEELGKRKAVVFDKDNGVVCDFIHAVVALRCEQHGIERPTKFDLMTLVGNIVPAVSSTNAIVGGMVVMMLIRYFQEGVSGCRNEYLTTGFRKWIQQEEIVARNEDCDVCGRENRIYLCDIDAATIEDLLVFFGVENAAVFSKDSLLYDEDFPDNFKIVLGELGVSYGELVAVEAGDRRMNVFVEEEEATQALC